MKKVAILGPGLLGGSIALSLRKRGEAQVAIWARRADAVEEVKAAGCSNLASTELREVVSGADVIVFATPIGAMPALASEIVDFVSPSVLVTDVGSVKVPVVEQLEAIFRNRARFVGGHPMAGSEQTGIKAARSDLFEGAICIVTPTQDTDAATVTDATAFWQTLGCTVRELSPAAHDEAVAWVSHLPHAIAAALVNTIAENDPTAFELCGPGFRDTTRVAGGYPPMWAEILGENRIAVRKSLDALIENLRELVTLLDRPDAERDTLMNHFFAQAKAQRDRLRLPK